MASRVHPENESPVVTVCEGCGLYVIEDRETVWESWDYGCVAGDDLTVAIILGRPLTRVTWLPPSATRCSVAPAEMQASDRTASIWPCTCVISPG